MELLFGTGSFSEEREIKRNLKKTWITCWAKNQQQTELRRKDGSEN